MESFGGFSVSDLLHLAGLAAAGCHETEEHGDSKSLSKNMEELEIFAPKDLRMFFSYTYDHGVDHCHKLFVDLLLSHGVEVHASLMGKEDSVLAFDHDGGKSKEDDTDHGGESATIAAARRHFSSQTIIF